MIPRLYVEDLIPSKEPDLRKDQINYLCNVMRLGPGDHVRFFCGDKFDYEYQITGLGRHEASLRFVEKHPMDKDPRIPIFMILPVLKGDKMADVIRDITALGVSTVQLCNSDRAVAKVSDAKLGRWRKIAEESCRQCGRTILPFIAPVPGGDASDLFQANADQEGSFRILFWEGEGEPLSKVITPDCSPSEIHLAIGQPAKLPARLAVRDILYAL